MLHGYLKNEEHVIAQQHFNEKMSTCFTHCLSANAIRPLCNTSTSCSVIRRMSSDNLYSSSWRRSSKFCECHNASIGTQH